jgi:hypothetical protein
MKDIESYLKSLKNADEDRVKSIFVGQDRFEVFKGRRRLTSYFLSLVESVVSGAV